jgi:hypothetical protein
MTYYVPSWTGVRQRPDSMAARAYAEDPATTRWSATGQTTVYVYNGGPATDGSVVVGARIYAENDTEFHPSVNEVESIPCVLPDETARIERVEVSKSGNGDGTVTSDPSGIDCGTDCVYGYLYGDNVTLYAEPSSGSIFDGWDGDCGGTFECELYMDTNKSVVAEFVRDVDEHGCSRSAHEIWCEDTQSCINYDYEACEPPSPGGHATVTVDSATCSPRERFSWGTVASWTIDSSGTASGPAGSYLQVQGDLMVDCGSWGSNCQRDSGEPESTSWHTQANGASGLTALVIADVYLPDGGSVEGSKYATQCVQ